MFATVSVCVCADDAIADDFLFTAAAAAHLFRSHFGQHQIEWNIFESVAEIRIKLLY